MAAKRKKKEKVVKHPPMNLSKPLVKPSSNPFRVETETGPNGPVPTLAVFVKKPQVDDLQAVLRQWPGYSIGTRALDEAGCTFKLTAVTPPTRDPDTGVIDLGNGKRLVPANEAARVSGAGLFKNVPVEPSELGNARVRLNLSLSRKTLAALKEKADAKGIDAGTYGRIIIQQHLGELKE